MHVAQPKALLALLHLVQPCLGYGFGSLTFVKHKVSARQVNGLSQSNGPTGDKFVKQSGIKLVGFGLPCHARQVTNGTKEASKWTYAKCASRLMALGTYSTKVSKWCY